MKDRVLDNDNAEDRSSRKKEHETIRGEIYISDLVVDKRISNTSSSPQPISHNRPREGYISDCAVDKCVYESCPLF